MAVFIKYIMAKYKLEIDSATCIGCAACSAVCDNWEMNGDKAVPKVADVDDVGCNKDAAENCPVTCIHITENATGKKLY